jgi:predicted O-methyltransferase YrrM
MDVSPEKTVSNAIDEVLSRLDHGTKAKMDITVTKAMLTTMVREAHVLQYKSALHELTEHLKERGVDTAAMEGSTSMFLEKVRFMQATALREFTADDHGKSSSEKTVCEVGFNAGHSALLWLLAGATRVVSFELGQHSYSHVAAEWLSVRFPGKLHLVMGDSMQSVPLYHTMFPDEKCNIVFIDGGHKFEHAKSDMLNFRKFVELSPSASLGHILLVDDTNMPEVGAAWAQAQAEGTVVEVGMVLSHCATAYNTPFSGSLQWNGNLFSETSESIRPYWAGSLSFGRYLP